MSRARPPQIHRPAEPGWLRALALALAPALLWGCATTGAPKAPEVRASDYAPFAVGASWTYEMNVLGQTGQRTVRVLAQDGEGYFIDDQNGAFKHTPSGLRDRDRYLVMHPLVVGHKWSARVGPVATERYEIVSVGARCEVPAGTFGECLTVEATSKAQGRDLVARFTWAKGVGLVKLETAIRDPEGKAMTQTTQSLRHYSTSGEAPPPAAAPAAAPAPAAPASDGSDDGPDTWEPAG